MRTLFLLLILFLPSLAFSEDLLVAEKILDGFDSATVARFPPGRMLKLLLAEQKGRVFWVDMQTKSASLFFDLSGGSKDIKIIDLAFHPQYDKNSRLFIAYLETVNENVDLAISEYVLNDKASLDLFKEILRVRQSGKIKKDFSINFDKNENLLIALPDGAENFDPTDRAQNRNELWGKLLRFNIKEADYVAPIDNPFVMEKVGKKEIYALGFREPVDMYVDGDNIWLVDIGADTFNELNLIKAGSNYGWSYYEGPQCLKMQMECSGLRVEKPVFEYPFREGKRPVLSSVYRGAKNKDFNGYVLLHDSSSALNWLIRLENDGTVKKRSIKQVNPELRFENIFSDSEGELYAISKTTVFSLAYKQTVK